MSSAVIGDRDLFRRDGADIESDGGVNPVERWAAGLRLQSLENFDDFALGPDHADVARASFRGPAQDTHIVTVAARDDDEVGGFVRIELLHRLVEIERMHFNGQRENVLGGVGGAVVSHDDVEACIAGNLAKVYSDMACTENIK